MFVCHIPFHPCLFLTSILSRVSPPPPPHLRTWDKSNGVLSTKLGWLEDIRLDRGVCWVTCQKRRMRRVKRISRLDRPRTFTYTSWRGASGGPGLRVVSKVMARCEMLAGTDPSGEHVGGRVRGMKTGWEGERAGDCEMFAFFAIARFDFVGRREHSAGRVGSVASRAPPPPHLAHTRHHTSHITFKKHQQHLPPQHARHHCLCEGAHAVPC